MKADFKESFLDDLRSGHDASLRSRVKEAIARVEGAQGLREVPNLKKLRGPGEYYRIRVGAYRLGLVLKGDTVVFVRFLHRRDIYKYFP